MPRVRVSSSQNCHEKEGRLLLAVQAIKKKEITSIREAARRFNVPESTLRTRLRGTTNRAESRANGHKLTEIEEEVLKQWILSLDLRGAAPTKAHVREMANILLAKRGSTPIQTVGQKWVYNYTQRHPELESRLSRQYDCQRAKQENPKVIQAWFNTVRATIEQYGILPDDIYNFDETGFAMGLCAHQKVITKSESCGRRPVLQPGNREWVTAIESISASGWALPPTLIFKGKQYNQAWFTGLPPDWRFEISTNGWTTNEISLRWLQKQFIPSTEHRTRGRYQLLVLDGHGSHLTPEFDQICTDHNIIPLCMPAHSSHLLQPLDIGCFAVLKRSYASLVDQKMRLGISHIDKLDFLAAYPQARISTFKLDTIRNSFRAAGLVPLNPEPVLSKLSIQARTPTPPGSRGSQASTFCPHTPANVDELLKQASLLRDFLKQRSKSPPSPSHNALNQLIKGCQIAMQKGILLEQENRALRAENAIQRRKRARTHRWIAHDNGLSVQEATELEEAHNASFQAIPGPCGPPAEGAQTPKARALPTCSTCHRIGHRRNACPNK
ncbi:hypothetical protein AN4391.2 [Aspergillus nidulans FGSC A4]|uniref:HTH CENPB-type domain-containing protein n=2 Tax=Emericella nidulans TaxID=162425 RepID=Q5AYS1_EMENI|nr:hypothetical protein [Aspergillus nidulans FGSC A4]XP_664163.1 hypothetical protein [Aspergillus nidulans FGSC A4]AAB48662.1 ORF [Aspergillus nidulans]EAA57899.1 hypothetical protein AN6559.2 [Aspergillus nidulans FGSC A4]EAA60308.1 hypothetical protein AN4391.2 [Aspergillus nidulans FGSC A4]CBF70985.1 TPA: ORFPutative uncharacterized protein; [Source:UniProtKB/TrEMBL;Acc:Q5AYS1] [Aspergillus nidulans FGSC A4]CBF77622.1 TPA: ORFPutative uncharacterized protein; [Source:UniProtKB/TrEMBL;Acc|eukprot:XP_661995.1 hypothetical protein AN4391.2 [Aspergillus nidulans FGSC A4]